MKIMQQVEIVMELYLFFTSNPLKLGMTPMMYNILMTCFCDFVNNLYINIVLMHSSLFILHFEWRNIISLFIIYKER